MSSLVCAQDPPASQKTSSISGTVTDAVSGQPLSGARVWARSFQPGQGARHFFSATTNSEGQFLLDGLIPDRYFVAASRDDYVAQRSGADASGRKQILLTPDQHVQGVVLQLMPGGTISGHIKNEAGNGVAGISVELLRYFYDGGQKQLHGVRPASLTDVDGAYHITGLGAGRYYLRASSAFASAAKSDAKAFYASAYYPGPSEISQSVELTTRPGENLSGIDLTLARVRPVEVTGRILMSSSVTGPAKAEVTLVAVDGNSDSMRQGNSDAKGNFALHDVLPGEYILMAQNELPEGQSKAGKNLTLFGSRPLKVGKVNVSKAEIIIAPGADVSGRIHIDDKSDTKRKIDLSRISIDLQAEGSSSVTSLMPAINEATVNADGSFLVTGVPQGSYSLNFSPLPEGYYLKTTGAADPAEIAVTITRGKAFAPLDLTLSSSVARLDGDVSTSDRPTPGASVLLIPEGNRVQESRYYRQSNTNQSGRFSMRNLIPGDYKIIAFEDIDRGAPLNPDFLEPFEQRAESVHLTENGSLTLHLDAIPASETSP